MAEDILDTLEILFQVEENLSFTKNLIQNGFLKICNNLFQDPNLLNL